MNSEEKPKRLYKALVTDYVDPRWLQRVEDYPLYAPDFEQAELYAHDLQEARKLFEEKYGVGHVFDLHNPDDATRLR